MRQEFIDDLVDWWHAYGAKEPWSVSKEPLSLDLAEAAEEFIDYMTYRLDDIVTWKSPNHE